MQGNGPARSKDSSASSGWGRQDFCWKAVWLQLNREECIGVDPTRKGGRVTGAETQWFGLRPSWGGLGDAAGEEAGWVMKFHGVQTLS